MTGVPHDASRGGTRVRQAQCLSMNHAGDTDDSDEGLMLAYAAGDASAFARLYGRHERPVYRYFLRQALAPASADDLLQDTWLAVVRAAERYSPAAKFTTWLYTIARNKLIDHWRVTRRDGWLDDAAANDPDDEPDFEERVAAPDSARPDVQAMSRQEAEAFIAAVEALPPVQRETFLLHVEGDATISEIAVITRVGVETARSRLRYAMNKLRGAWAARNAVRAL